MTECGSIARVGPRPALVASDAWGTLAVGADSNFHYGELLGGVAATWNAQEGMTAKSKYNLNLAADDGDIYVTDYTRQNLRGGWKTPKTQAQFNVGDFENTESLAIETNDAGGFSYFTIRPTDATSPYIRRIHIIGSHVASSYPVQLIVGGRFGETWGDPNNFNNPTLLVTGDDYNNATNAMYVYDRKTSRNAGSEVFTIKSADASGSTFYMLRILNNAGAGVFDVDSNGNVHADGAYTSPAADFAECVRTDKDYMPGTVLKIQDGEYVQTEAVGEPSVAGVVSLRPGVLLGRERVYDCSNVVMAPRPMFFGKLKCLTFAGLLKDVGPYVRVGKNRYFQVTDVQHPDSMTVVHLHEPTLVSKEDDIWLGVAKRKNVSKLAFVGVVPVRCSTLNGNIMGNGELLVSGPEGCAVLAPENPAPGTVIGKALGKLVSLDGGEALGIVDVHLSPQ